jgi:phosphatidate cytidylyltransferase
MKRIATAAILVPVVLILVLRAPVPLVALFAGVVAVLALREFFKIAQSYGITPIRLPLYILSALLFAAVAFQSTSQPLLATALMMYAVGFVSVLAPFLLMSAAMTRPELGAGLPAASAGSFAIGYIALPLALVVQLRHMWAGSFLVLYLLLLVWVGDTAAYYAGRTLGRHKLAPRISPGKTWEGSIASFIASVALGLWMFAHAREVSEFLLSIGLIERAQGYFSPEIPSLPTVGLLSAAINIAAQLGDLVESLIKRGAGIKDSGSLLPGHGGVLDRIDALLFAAPVLWYYAALQVISQGHA